MGWRIVGDGTLGLQRAQRAWTFRHIAGARMARYHRGPRTPLDLIDMLKRLFDRLRKDASEQRAETIRGWVERQPGVTLISSVIPRTVAKVAGVVEVLRVRPRQGVQAFEADVTDGTGTVTAVWLGRSTVPGVSIGARVVLEGRFGGERDDLQVINPSFEFASSGG